MNSQIFGVLLEEVPLKEGLPLPVYDSLKYFKENPTLLETEGLFRIPGNMLVVNNLKKEYNEGKEVKLEGENIHTIASLFKLYFRELPDSLVTEENTDLFLVFIELDKIDKNQTIKKLQNVLKELPQVHLNVLKSLIGFLVQITEKSDLNKMDSRNLSLIFGPNIFNHQEALDLVRPDNPATTCTQYFIDNYHQIFDSLDVFFPLLNTVDNNTNTPSQNSQINEVNSQQPLQSSNHLAIPNKPLPNIPINKDSLQNVPQKLDDKIVIQSHLQNEPEQHN
ncbi:hypothetical protein ENUP19_0274G0081 [Entamoeba nuttalli]|uniref:RhoGAP domain containing protein n=2 Tax=Entamoeba nuttalli TaxID=412467 RepID=K2H5K9_ENTNP|nr:RhoGAP domain containing protein [Entamoeba nuttalli P19]EKE41652.1 RhoGAP domain containing protein [Entamoeba nuttalli P19]|eukprot:XP_008856014.1 RhoGAP domain containing protein [Entamoeba nuttalli P19]